MEKRGQFYLMSGIIIIAVIISFTLISNYAKRESNVKLYDIEDELGIESAKVLEYGVYQDYDREEMNDLLERFSREYADYAGEGKNLYFIYGDSDGITVVSYQDLSEEDAYIDIGGTDYPLTGSGTPQQFFPEGNKVKIEIGGNEYEFNLKKGENFYFIVRQDIEGEKNVVIGG